MEITTTAYELEQPAVRAAFDAAEAWFNRESAIDADTWRAAQRQDGDLTAARDHYERRLAHLNEVVRRRKLEALMRAAADEAERWAQPRAVHPSEIAFGLLHLPRVDHLGDATAFEAKLTSWLDRQPEDAVLTAPLAQFIGDELADSSHIHATGRGVLYCGPIYAGSHSVCLNVPPRVQAWFHAYHAAGLPQPATELRRLWTAVTRT